MSDKGLPSHGQIILNVLARYEPLAPHEIAGYCNLAAHEIGRRMSELRRGGLIERATAPDGAPLVRETPRGRQSSAYRIARS